VFSLVATHNAAQAHWLHHSSNHKFQKQKISDSCDCHYQLFGVTTSTVTASTVAQPKIIFQHHTGPIIVKHHHQRDRRSVLEERLKSRSVARCEKTNCVVVDEDDKHLSEESMLEEKEQQLAMCNSISATSTVLMASDGCGCQFCWDDTSSALF
jgi:K+-sensing histidine kinase KdpD